MPEREVCSPINRRSGDLPLNPGARSSPSRGRTDSVPPQPIHSARHSEPSSEFEARTQVTGPPED
jgi:hypothetical protein